MALTALDIKDKTFKLKFRGYDEEEVNEFLDIVVDDYEDLVRRNHEQENRIKDLEDKLAYFDEMKESLSQSVILAQEQLKKLKHLLTMKLLTLLAKLTMMHNILLMRLNQKLIKFYVMQLTKLNVLL